jgi:hypothetical protein
MAQLAAVMTSDARHGFREDTHRCGLREGISVGPVFLIGEVAEQLEGGV